MLFYCILHLQNLPATPVFCISTMAPVTVLYSTCIIAPRHCTV